MLNLHEIYKPTTLADALKQLQQPDTVALAGGTELIAGARHDIHAVVDLSALRLSYIRESGGSIAIGATTTLAELAESPILRAVANGVVAQAAHRSAANVLRNQETVAGTLIVEPDSLLAVTLLALDARATVVRKETRAIPLYDFLPMREHLLMMALLTEINIPIANPNASLQIVARTPSDKPIVSVCAIAYIDSGMVRLSRIALGGIAETAVRITDAEKEIQGKGLSESVIEKSVEVIGRSSLQPRGDYRGSTEYRKEMATVLARRALKELI